MSQSELIAKRRMAAISPQSPANAASIRLAHGAGYARISTIAGSDGAPIDLYARLRPKGK